jgi:hypothetical protein
MPKKNKRATIRERMMALSGFSLRAAGLYVIHPHFPGPRPTRNRMRRMTGTNRPRIDTPTDARSGRARTRRRACSRTTIVPALERGIRVRIVDTTMPSDVNQIHPKSA